MRRLLARRCQASGAYEVEVPDEGDEMVRLHLLDADVLVLVEGHHVDGTATTALSYLGKHGSDVCQHLNGWRREGGMDVGALVDDLWRAFWAHEQENEGLGRTLWMHGPTLPVLAEDVCAPDEPVQVPLDFTSPVVQPPPERVSPAPRVPKPRTKVHVDQNVLDLFGD